MKPSFHTRLTNGPFDDPGLYVRVLREGRALMFDMGFTTTLSVRDILKTTHIFISHTHVDHFIGFDHVLRICLKREQPLYLFGPEGFIDCVAGKLAGYTWNLIEGYPLVISVSEVTGTRVRMAVFKAKNSFKREEGESKPFNGLLFKDSTIAVSAAILDHQVPCLAFSLEEDCHINIDKVKLSNLNLSVGPWLNELKTAIREEKTSQEFVIDGESYMFSDVKDVATITRGQKLSYVVDVLGSEENIEKIVKLVKSADTLYIESYFLDEDREKAKDRYHLTAREAGRIAREAGVGQMEVMHFSPRYLDAPERLIQEAAGEFAE